MPTCRESAAERCRSSATVGNQAGSCILASPRTSPRSSSPVSSRTTCSSPSPRTPLAPDTPCSRRPRPGTNSDRGNPCSGISVAAPSASRLSSGSLVVASSIGRRAASPSTTRWSRTSRRESAFASMSDAVAGSILSPPSLDDERSPVCPRIFDDHRRPASTWIRTRRVSTRRTPPCTCSTRHPANLNSPPGKSTNRRFGNCWTVVRSATMNPRHRTAGTSTNLTRRPVVVCHSRRQVVSWRRILSPAAFAAAAAAAAVEVARIVG